MSKSVILSYLTTAFSLVAQRVKNWLSMQETSFNPWVGKIPWRGKWQPMWMFLAREFHAQRNLAGYNPWGCKELDMIEHAPCIYFTSIHFPTKFVLILLKVYWTTCYNYPVPFETFFSPESKKVEYLVFSSVQFSSVAQSCPTLWDPMDCRQQASLSIINSQSLLKLVSIESLMSSNHLTVCHPLLLPPSTFPS